MEWRWRHHGCPQCWCSSTGVIVWFSARTGCDWSGGKRCRSWGLSLAGLRWTQIHLLGCKPPALLRKTERKKGCCLIHTDLCFIVLGLLGCLLGLFAWRKQSLCVLIKDHSNLFITQEYVLTFSRPSLSRQVLRHSLSKQVLRHSLSRKVLSHHLSRQVLRHNLSRQVLRHNLSRKVLTYNLSRQLLTKPVQTSAHTQPVHRCMWALVWAFVWHNLSRQVLRHYLSKQVLILLAQTCVQTQPFDSLI